MSITSDRKKEHIELCLTDDVLFKNKTTGFENYDFIHYAPTQVDIAKIDFTSLLFNKTIQYPFLISCMTGGGADAQSINSKLAVAAEILKIPVGVGSQRQAMENDQFLESYKTLRKNAPGIPLFGNIGAAQVCKSKELKKLRVLVDMIEGDALFVHLNPLQEMVQKEGETDFKDLIKKLEKLIKVIDVPVYVKEVGAGISSEAAKILLEIGVEGIDVAGAGGTSWAGVEILRDKENKNMEFWDWGLPTSYCIRKISKLKKKFKFKLIGSGGINNPFDMAKAFALGADITGSAKTILNELDKNDVEGVVNLVVNWFDDLKKIMFLTGSHTLTDLQKQKLLKKEKLF